MGSIENIFDLFVNGIYGFLGAGSSAVDTGSTVAGGLLSNALGSVEGVLGNGGPIG